jgi:hypothetical protein
MNGMTLVFFLMSGWITSCPSILETWHTSSINQRPEATSNRSRRSRR